MANFRKVNQFVKRTFPELDIEVVRGEGYVYFSGPDGLGKVDSIMTHPTSTSTEDVIRMVMDSLLDLAEQEHQV